MFKNICSRENIKHHNKSIKHLESYAKIKVNKFA